MPAGAGAAEGALAAGGVAADGPFVVEFGLDAGAAGWEGGELSQPPMTIAITIDVVESALMATIISSACGHAAEYRP